MNDRPADHGQHWSDWLDDEQSDGIDSAHSHLPNGVTKKAREITADEMVVHGLLRDRADGRRLKPFRYLTVWV